MNNFIIGILNTILIIHLPTLCFCPPDNVAPRSPTRVSYFYKIKKVKKKRQL
jgi:hypothetical protein